MRFLLALFLTLAPLAARAVPLWTEDFTSYTPTDQLNADWAVKGSAAQYTIQTVSAWGGINALQISASSPTAWVACVYTAQSFSSTGSGFTITIRRGVDRMTVFVNAASATLDGTTPVAGIYWQYIYSSHTSTLAKAWQGGIGSLNNVEAVDYQASSASDDNFSMRVITDGGGTTEVLCKINGDVVHDVYDAGFRTSGLVGFQNFGNSNTVLTNIDLDDNTAGDTFTYSPTISPTFTTTPTPNGTSTYSPTSTFTSTITYSPTDTVTDTPTSTHSPTFTTTPTNSPSPTDTWTPTITKTATLTETTTSTMTPSVTETDTPTATPSSSPTPTVTDTPTSTASPTASPTPTDQDTATSTWTPTVTKTQTASVTPTFTFTQTITETASPTATPTVSPSPTVTDTPTSTDSPTATPTDTPTVTDSYTQSDTFTNSPTDSPTPTQTKTATPSPSPTPTYSFSPTITPTFTPACQPFVDGVSSTISDSSSYTWSHTVTAANHSVLVVSVIEYQPTAVVQSVTYNGVALTQAVTDGAGNVEAEIWYLNDPEQGTHDVVVTLDTDRHSVAGAVSYGGAGTVTGNASSTTGSGTSISDTITTTGDYSALAVLAVQGTADVEVSATSPMEAQWNQSNTGLSCMQGNQTTSPAGDQVYAATFGASGDNTILSLEIPTYCTVTPTDTPTNSPSPTISATSTTTPTASPTATISATDTVTVTPRPSPTVGGAAYYYSHVRLAGNTVTGDVFGIVATTQDVRLRSIQLMVDAGATFNPTWSLVRRSTEDFGTETVVTDVNRDSLEAPATAKLVTYAFDPTLGQEISPLGPEEASVTNPTTSTARVVWSFDKDSRDLVLHPGEALYLNLGGMAVSDVRISLFWIEGEQEKKNPIVVVFPTATISPTFSVSPTFTSTATDTPTATPSWTSSQTTTPTWTLTHTFSPSITPTSTRTPAEWPWLTATQTPTPTMTISPTKTITLTHTFSPTSTTSPTPRTPTATQTYTATSTPTTVYTSSTYNTNTTDVAVDNNGGGTGNIILCQLKAGTGKVDKITEAGGDLLSFQPGFAGFAWVTVMLGRYNQVCTGGASSAVTINPLNPNFTASTATVTQFTNSPANAGTLEVLGTMHIPVIPALFPGFQRMDARWRFPNDPTTAVPYIPDGYVGVIIVKAANGFGSSIPFPANTTASYGFIFTEEGL